MIYNRTSSCVNDAKKGALPGLSTLYHYVYEYAEGDVFVGMCVLQDEGLDEVTVGELRMATSTLQQGAGQRVKVQDYSGVKSTKTWMQLSGLRNR
jgi:hypothetical protein